MTYGMKSRWSVAVPLVLLGFMLHPDFVKTRHDKIEVPANTGAVFESRSLNE